MRLTKLKRKTKKALAASARANYDQKRKGNRANTCVGNFLQLELLKILFKDDLSQFNIRKEGFKEKLKFGFNFI